MVDAALRREVASADAEFLAWQRQELEPHVDRLRREWEGLQEKVTHLFPGLPLSKPSVVGADQEVQTRV